jgi:hypothetical protein
MEERNWTFYCRRPKSLRVSLKKSGITPEQSVDGCRLSAMLERLGVSKDHFEAFVSEIYNGYKDNGLNPLNAMVYMKELRVFQQWR